MTKLVVFLVVATVSAAFGQTAPAKGKTVPKQVPVKTFADKSVVDRGSVSGRTYTNRPLGFEVTFPDTWLIPGDDFESEMKRAGYDLTLKAPSNLSPVSRAKIEKALKGVTIAVTAYRSMPGSDDNAIARISIEDLTTNPQIKDAIDYFDAMRSQFKTMNLPVDFRYSETQAERLGKWQFAYIDSSSTAGKKRLYATVRKGYAILFSLSYNKDEDLAALRQILSQGNFSLK